MLDGSGIQSGRGIQVKTMARLDSMFNKVITKIENFFFFLGSLFLFGMMLLMIVSIIARIFLDLGLAWAVEISEYAMVFISFFVASWVLREDGHVTMDLFIERIKPSLRWKLDVLISVMILAISFMLVFYSTKMVLDLYERHIMLIGTLITPKYLIAVAIPIGSAVLLLRSLQRLMHRMIYRNETPAEREQISI